MWSERAIKSVTRCDVCLMVLCMLVGLLEFHCGVANSLSDVVILRDGGTGVCGLAVSKCGQAALL